MWRYTEKSNEKAKISLHDCRATRMFINDGNLHFEYNDGFWVLTTNENNPHNETFKTDLSQLKVCNFEIENIYIFNKFRLFRRLISTKRIDITIETLIDNINNGKWELEFLYEYHTYQGMLFNCWIWMNQKPCHKECQIALQCDDMEYFWNNICIDKPW